VSILTTIRQQILTHASAAPAQPPVDASAGLLAGLGAGTAAMAAATVDVEQVLEQISREKGNPQLNWKSSIVDLMKLLGLDSSLDNRRELATELGYQGEKNGSAEMNIFLHRKVMEDLENNGGKVSDALKS